MYAHNNVTQIKKKKERGRERERGRGKPNYCPKPYTNHV